MTKAIDMDELKDLYDHICNKDWRNWNKDAYKDAIKLLGKADNKLAPQLLGFVSECLHSVQHLIVFDIDEYIHGRSKHDTTAVFYTLRSFQGMIGMRNELDVGRGMKEIAGIVESTVTALSFDTSSDSSERLHVKSMLEEMHIELLIKYLEQLND